VAAVCNDVDADIAIVPHHLLEDGFEQHIRTLSVHRLYQIQSLKRIRDFDGLLRR
jgi:hypothetical protein